MVSTLRLLLLADTHLGFDHPMRPRVGRPRRGPDFFANTRRALEPALRGEVDLVVHGGDLLYRSKVGAALVAMAVEPLLEVADAGVPVVLVPGNHERSALPFPILAAHANLHVLSRPTTVVLGLRGMRVAVGGFPCERTDIRGSFRELVRASDLLNTEADVRLLCLHQTVEGATVGPSDFVFRSGVDVIPGRDIPAGLAAVLAGHIHRVQTLTHDLRGLPLAAPVLYPGAIERTSRAERGEEKGFLTLEIEGTSDGGRIVRRHFHRLPARALESLEIDVTGRGPRELAALLRSEFDRLPEEAAVTVKFVGRPSDEAREILRAPRLRELAPPTMIVEVARPDSQPYSAVR